MSVYLLWAAAAPASLYVSKAVGQSVARAFTGGKSPEPLATDLDTEGVLSAAEHALSLEPVSKYSKHLQGLLRESRDRLVRHLEDAEARVNKKSYSRIFRDPDFSKENRNIRSELKILRSRIELFKDMYNVFPQESLLSCSEVCDARVDDVVEDSSSDESESMSDSATGQAFKFMGSVMPFGSD